MKRRKMGSLRRKGFYLLKRIYYVLFCAFINKKNTVIYILFLFSIFLFTECSDKLGKYNYINYKKLNRPDKTRRLTSTVVVDENRLGIGLLSMLKIINDYLIVVDSKADKLIKIIDTKSNALLESFGNKGEGPEEFIDIWQIIPDPKENTAFWIYDGPPRHLKKFNLKNILNNDFHPEEIIRIQSEKSGLPLQLAITPDEKIVGIGLFLKGRLSIYDMKGRYIKSIGKIPVILKDERFSSQHSQGFWGDFVFEEISKKIFVTPRLGSIIEEYSIDKNIILSTYYGPDKLFFPEYDIVPAGNFFTMTYNKKSRFGYVDICYSKAQDKIFLLYSGKYQYNKEKKDPVFANTIYVFDDNKEKIVEKILLDREIYSMDISSDGSFLFGLRETEILKFEYEKMYIGENLKKEQK